MNKVIESSDKKIMWHENKQCVSDEDCVNPGRGWYQIYSMQAECDAPVYYWLGSISASEKLVMLRICLKKYANDALDEACLSHIADAMDFFREHDKDMLVRFTYDEDGRGLEHEPYASGIIRSHMRQLSPLFHRFEKHIFCVQGLFIGSWGEMHGSRYLVKEEMSALWHELSEATPPGCFLGVRTPAQYRMLAGDLPEGKASDWSRYEQEKIRSLRLGLYNDGLLGSETDLGTYSFDRIQDELDFQDALCRFVPNGGEAVMGPWKDDVNHVAAHFGKIHISYLNCVHDKELIERWKKGRYGGMSAYSYIGMHLGYRFVLHHAVVSPERRKIKLQTENCGFAGCCEECSVKLVVFCKEQLVDEQILDIDIRTWQPGGYIKCESDIRELICRLETGEYILYLSVTRKKDGCPIVFANKGAGSMVELGRLYV